MSNTRLTIAALTLAGGLLVVQPAFASHHLWDFSEAFSNADGSIQFIELQTTFNSQNFLQGTEIRSLANGVVTAIFTFPTNVPPNTADHSLLLATPDFAALKGVPAPDFIIPAQFFDPNTATITLNYALGADIWTFQGPSLPTDCMNSLHRIMPGGAVFVAAASPTNFAGQTATGNLCATDCPADINGSGAVDIHDLLAVIGAWGSCQGCAADIDESGTVNIADLLAVISAWGSCL